MKEVERRIDACGMRYIKRGVKTCMSFLQGSEVYELDEDQFIKSYCDRSLEIWKASRAMALKGYTTHAEYQLQRESENQYNYYSKGVMKTLGSQAIASMGRGLEEMTYGKQESVVNNLADGVEYAVLALSGALMNALAEKAGVYSEMPSGQSAKTAEAYANNLAQGNVPKEKQMDLLIDAVQMDPYNEKIYKVGFDLFGDPEGELEAYEKHFGGHTLAKYKGEKVSKQMKDLPLKFAEDAEPAREKVKAMCAAYGTDAAPHLQVLEKRIADRQNGWEKERQARDQYFTALRQYKSTEELERLHEEAKKQLAECEQKHEDRIKEDPALYKLHKIQKYSTYGIIAGVLLAIFFVFVEGNWLSLGTLLMIVCIGLYWYMGRQKDTYIKEHGSEAVKNSLSERTQAKQRVQELETMQNAIKSYTSQYGAPPVTMEEWEKTAPGKAIEEAADKKAGNAETAEPAADENGETVEQPTQAE